MLEEEGEGREEGMGVEEWILRLSSKGERNE